MTGTTILVAQQASYWIWTTFMLCWFAKQWRGVRLAATIFYNLKPFAVPLIAAQFVTTVAMSPRINLGADLTLILDVAFWWVCVRRDKDDDDRWRKRGRKLAGKIRALDSGRLAVEPA